MGSGLILLVIVGAWLAVLVPMGLRAHDGAATSRSAERWSDAMRVLSRRSEVATLTDEADAPGVADPAEPVDLEDEPAHTSRLLAGLRGWLPAADLADLLRLPAALLRGARAALADRRAHRLPATPAARRRRVLLGLLVVMALAVIAGQVGPAWLLDVAGAAAVLALLFLVSCRRAAARRAVRLPARPSLRAEQRHDVVLPAVVERPAAEHAVEELPADAPAAPAVVAQRSRPAAGAEWQPVPVPLPMYVTAPAARSVRVLPSEPETSPAEADDEQGVFEPRRVVGGW